MGRIPEDTIREIRDRVDIVGLIGRFVELKRAGRNFKGLCPFHGEKTPSFNVSPDKQIYHCFGCGEGGDVMAFMMRHDGLNFPEAARVLAGELGIEIPESDGAPRGETEQILAANDLAQSLYREALASAEGEPARKYLEGRGLDAGSIERFGIGYAPNRWDAVAEALQRARIEAKVGEMAGLLAPRRSGQGYYDRLRGRVTFPIQDLRGRIVGFGGRALFPDQEPKYLNTPESPVFHKRRALYGLHLALEGMRRAERSIVCEGYFDRIALHRAGLSEGVATCGTALTAEHGSHLRRRTREVVLLFDGDAAGQKAVERALELLLPEGLRVKAAVMPAGDDPDTFLAARGAEALRELVDRAPDALEVVIQEALSQGWTTPTAKADTVARIAPLIAKIPNRVERDEWARRLSVAIDSDVASVHAVVRSEATGRGAARNEALSSIEAAPVAPRRLSVEERHLADLAGLLYRNPELAGRHDRTRIHTLLPDGSWKAIVEFLLDAAASESIDESGAIDLFAIEDRLDEESRGRLRELAVRDIESERPAELVLDDLVRHFEKRRHDARMKELTRRMREPGADTDSLLREKQKLNEEARAKRASS